LAQQGPSLPTGATGNTNTVGGGTRVWANPGNITLADSVDAIATFLAAAASSDDLIGFAFGFTVPLTATIDGILLEINYQQTAGLGSVNEKNVRLLRAGVASGSDFSTAATLPGTAATVSYGGASNLWGTTWTPTDINDTNFGACFVCQDNSGLAASAGVDFFRITVFFHTIFSSSISLTATASQVSGAANKMNAAITTSATAGYQDIASLVMNSALALSNTAVLADLGADIPGLPSITLTATAGAAITGVTVLGTQALAFGNTAGFAETGGVGNSRGITLPASPGAFFSAIIGGNPLLTSDAYTSLVTSEHNKRPNFMAMIAVQVQAYVDNINLLRSFAVLFDLDFAAGQQLDMIGVWVGASRNIPIPLTGVYFAFNTANLGFNQGTWFGIGDSASGLTTLSDDQYRLLLRAKIASNHWDGTVPGAYAIWAIVFKFEPFNILIQDNQDMTMQFTLVGTNIPAVTKALLTNGLIALIPAGVSATYVVP
jgi:hypothetical protein